MEANGSHHSPSTAHINVGSRQAQPRIVAPSRACEECKRKKTKCDMTRPRCSLCTRGGKTCFYPTQRRRPEFRRNSSGKAKRSRHELEQKIDSLMQLMTRTEPVPTVTARSTSDSPRHDDIRRNSTPGASTTWTPPLHREMEPDAEIDKGIQRQTSSDSRQIDSSCQLFDQGLLQAEIGPWDIRNGFDTVLDDGLSMLENFSPDRLVYNDQLLSRMMVDQEDGVYSSTQTRKVDDTVFSAPKPPEAIPAIDEMQSSPRTRTHSLTSPTSLIDELIDLFFTEIHGFLPIFCQQRFEAQHVPRTANAQTRYQNLPVDTAFILYGMLSLSARFSDSPTFNGKAPSSRGVSFAKGARSLYEEFRRDNEEGTPSFAFLHGCILLDFYQLTSGPCHFGWILTGICIRLAYDLGLDTTDEDIVAEDRSKTDQWNSVDEWVEREERRRAWWSVWELDAYASTLSGRPYAIDQSQMHVLLPASDQNWFSRVPIASTALGPDPVTAYKCLRNCANQDERAWFLVVNALLLRTHALWRQRVVSRRSKEEMESVLSCFTMILPSKFHVDSGSLSFDNGASQQSNWIILTNVLLQSARIITALTGNKRHNGQESTCSVSSEGSQSPASPIEEYEGCVRRCRQCTKEVCRTIRAWSPEYIPLASPFIVTSLIGPAAMHFGKTHDNYNGRQSIDREMLELTIGQFAKFWDLGALMLGKWRQQAQLVIIGAFVDKAAGLTQALKEPVFAMPSISKLAGDDLLKRIATILP